MRTVEPADWVSTLAGMRAGGYAYLDHLTGIDRLGSVEVIVHLLDPATCAHELVSTTVAGDEPVLPSITGLFPGAGWHEREAAELLGIVFAGHPDPRPLLLRRTSAAAPLRRSTVLPARLETDWPGFAEQAPSGGAAPRRAPRRRQLAPGVQPTWLDEGDG